MAVVGDAKFARLIGLAEAKRQIGQLPEIVRASAMRPIASSTDDIAADARMAAPRRDPNELPGYRGGMLQAHVVGRVSEKHLIGMVGIERGAMVVVGGRRELVSRRVVRRKLKKDGTYRDIFGKSVVTRAQRAQIRAAKGLVIQPTKYGHLMEFSSRSFLRPAVRRRQAGFESGVRETAPDVIAALQQLRAPVGGGA